ncbi:pentatricopeptide repeat-containing protein [Tanacetum coccineum]
MELRSKDESCNFGTTTWTNCNKLNNGLVIVNTKVVYSVQEHDIDGMATTGEGVREAWRVFECLEFRNNVTWNSTVVAFESGGKWEDAVELLTLMRRDCDVGYDRATLLSILLSLLIVEDMVVM